MAREIIYSASHVYDIKREDPTLEKLRQRWERAIGSRVSITELDGRLIVKPEECNTDKK